MPTSIPRVARRVCWDSVSNVNRPQPTWFRVLRLDGEARMLCRPKGSEWGGPDAGGQTHHSLSIVPIGFFLNPKRGPVLATVSPLLYTRVMAKPGSGVGARWIRERGSSKYESRSSKYESRSSKFEVRESKFEGRESKFEGRGARDAAGFFRTCAGAMNHRGCRLEDRTAGSWSASLSPIPDVRNLRRMRDEESLRRLRT